MKLLVTGGAGFIGSNFLNRFVSQNPEIQFLNLDALTYAGNPQNLVALNNLPNYQFYQCDLRDAERTHARSCRSSSPPISSTLPPKAT
ncbi:MAG: GDP-mannose 4,6-dehydratase [Fimbriimonadaceae bacterium]